jgi:hypothetical protein
MTKYKSIGNVNAKLNENFQFLYSATLIAKKTMIEILPNAKFSGRVDRISARK